MNTWLKDGQEFTESEIRTINPNVLFGVPFNPISLGYQFIHDTPSPTVTDLQIATHNGTETDSKGNLVRAWAIQPKFVTVEEETTYIAQLQVDIENDLKEHFKSMYLAHVNAKLKELDYDSLATVKLWEGDATFGVEATRILNWYKAIIAMNYQLITNVTTGTVQIPDNVAYQAMLDAVVF